MSQKEQQIRELQRLMFIFVNEMLVNGTESLELDKLLTRYRRNAEFVRLATLARRLKQNSI